MVFLLALAIVGGAEVSSYLPSPRPLADSTVSAQDTVTLSAGEALRRALEANPVTAAARSRTLAAESRVRQARTLGNPTLNAAAENLGAAVETTGQPAWQGTEGQILLGLRIPLGGDRRATILRSEALAVEASALEGTTLLDFQVETVDAIARLVHDRALTSHAVSDAEVTQRLADAAEGQAEAGRTSEGDAARLRLASASAWARVAAARAAEARSAADLARVLHMDVGTPLRLTLPVCPWEEPAPPGGTSDALPNPDLAAAEARARGWQAAAEELRAQAIPDLLPQLGWRRSGGYDALYVGLQLELPLFDRRQGARQAARLEASAAEQDAASVSARLEAERTAARDALEALASAGNHFDAGWARALARAVESTEARYALGEGTLTELLDSRRARLDALSAFEAWRMQLFGWRTRLTRSSGLPITERVLCDPTPNLESLR